METSDSVRLHAVPHPTPEVRQAGFPLDHPYVEQCWVAVLGPTSITLLRRISQMWEDDLSPTIPTRDLSGMIGLGNSYGRRGVLWRTFDRLDRFRFAHISGPGEIDIYTEAPPLSDTQLGRVRPWTRERHYRLLDDHLARLAELQRGRAARTAGDLQGTDGVAPRRPARPSIPSLHR